MTSLLISYRDQLVPEFDFPRLITSINKKKLKRIIISFYNICHKVALQLPHLDEYPENL